MHFELLVEDKSGSIAVDILLEKILGANNADHSWRIHPYRASAAFPCALAPVRTRAGGSSWIASPNCSEVTGVALIRRNLALLWWWMRTSGIAWRSSKIC